MKQRRILWHIVFWLVQYSISLYNELYLSRSFSEDPGTKIVFQTAGSLLLLLLIKITVTYYILYYLIPRWIKAPEKILLYIEAVVIILLSTLLVRITMQYFIWRVIFKEPAYELSTLQWTARYFYSLLDILQIVGLASAIKLFKLRIATVKNEKLLVQEKLRSELLHLKSQVNPHFLFNTINSIYSLTRAQSSSASDAILRLSKILRYMLYETSERTINLEDELKLIDDYIELQQLRFGNRLKVEIKKNIGTHPAQLTPLLLLPLVENAFKHGSNEGGTITINISLEGSLLFFEVSNPYSENAFKIKGEQGIGIVNITRQLELLYPGSSLETRVKENTFKVELKIDLSTYAGAELFDNRR